MSWQRLEALALLCRQYDRDYTVETLTQGMAIGEGHVWTAQRLKAAAQRQGLVANFTNTHLFDLDFSFWPCLLMLRKDRACILHKIDFAGNNDAMTPMATVSFPESGGSIKEIPLDELLQIYESEALQIGIPPAIEETTPKPLTAIWQQIRNRLRNPGRRAIIAAVFLHVATICTSLISMRITDAVIPYGLNAINTLVFLGLIAAIFHFTEFTARLSRSVELDDWSISSRTQLTTALCANVFALPIPQYPANPRQLLTSIRDLESAWSAYSSARLIAITDGIAWLTYLAAIIYISGWVVILPIVLAAFTIGISLSLQARIHHRSVEFSRWEMVKQTTILEGLSNILAVKFHPGLANVLLDRVERATTESTKHDHKLRQSTTFLTTVLATLPSLNNSIITIAAVIAIINGQMAFGALLATTMLARSANGCISQLANLFPRYQQFKQAKGEVEKWLDTTLETSRVDDQISIEHLPHASIQVIDVHYTYPNQEKPTLNGVNLQLLPGQRLAIIGHSWSGKSTLAKLMAGIDKPNSGTILAGNIPINDIPAHDLRRCIGTASQHDLILSGSLRANLTLGRPFSDQALSNLLTQLAGPQFLIDLEGGIKAKAAENGDNLSGGQRQILSIARALIAEPDILILDEATSHLDAKLEHQILSFISQWLGQTRSMIMISHRPSVHTFASHIATMQSGRIVAYGVNPQYKTS